MVRFFVEDVDFKLSGQKVVSNWLQEVAEGYGATIHDLNYIFVSDQYLLKLNQNYLDHDTLTDIITFPYVEDEHTEIGGDIYISIDRVKENALEFGVPFENELRRVIVHGLLHLCGLKDKTDAEAKAMRNAENAALEKLGN
jgi:rRNA maturation RNase YbeY